MYTIIYWCVCCCYCSFSGNLMVMMSFKHFQRFFFYHFYESTIELIDLCVENYKYSNFPSNKSKMHSFIIVIREFILFQYSTPSIEQFKILLNSLIHLSHLSFTLKITVNFNIHSDIYWLLALALYWDIRYLARIDDVGWSVFVHLLSSKSEFNFKIWWEFNFICECSVSSEKFRSLIQTFVFIYVFSCMLTGGCEWDYVLQRI